MENQRVVIIGGGFGGLRCARELARHEKDVSITLIDRRNHHLFQPLLYQVATAGLSATNIAMPIRSALHRYSNVEVLLGEVTGIDLATRWVQVGNPVGGRRVPYDTLVIATGASHSYFKHPEWEKFAPGLKSLQDAVKIRRKVLLAFEAAEVEPDLEKQKALLTFVIVGGGPTGVELAGSIAELARFALAADFRHVDPASARVVLVEAGPRLLASFPEDLGRAAQGELERLGVEVRTGARVDQLDERGVSMGAAHIASSTVIWAAGVVASPAGKWLGVETDPAGRVLVQADLTVKGHPEIFVIGDTARARQPLPGLAPVAIQQGAFVARTIERRLRGDASAREFHYLDKGNLATVGRSYAVADIGRFHFAGRFAWLTWVVVHIYFLIGFRNRLLVILEWAWAYLTFQRGARIIAE